MTDPSELEPGDDATEAVLDLDVFDRLVGEADDDEGRDIMRRVIASYCSGRLWSEAREAFDTGDWELLERSAHSVKGLGRTLGTMAVAAVAGALEQAAERRDAPASAPLLGRLASELERAYRALGHTDLYDRQLVEELRTAVASRRSGD